MLALTGNPCLPEICQVPSHVVYVTVVHYQDMNLLTTDAGTFEAALDAVCKGALDKAAGTDGPALPRGLVLDDTEKEQVVGEVTQICTDLLQHAAAECLERKGKGQSAPASPEGKLIGQKKEVDGRELLLLAEVDEYAVYLCSKILPLNTDDKKKWGAIARFHKQMQQCYQDLTPPTGFPAASLLSQEQYHSEFLAKCRQAEVQIRNMQNAQDAKYEAKRSRALNALIENMQSRVKRRNQIDSVNTSAHEFVRSTQAFADKSDKVKQTSVCRQYRWIIILTVVILAIAGGIVLIEVLEN